MGGLPSGNVGVDEDGFDPLFPQGLESLGAGVVKLAGLTNAETARADDHHLANIGTGDFGENLGGNFAGKFRG